jgi:hypothetical protein
LSRRHSPGWEHAERISESFIVIASSLTGFKGDESGLKTCFVLSLSPRIAGCEIGYNLTQWELLVNPA